MWQTSGAQAGVVSVPSSGAGPGPVTARITKAASQISPPASPATEAARNAMRLVPRALNGRIFDFFLRMSLGENAATARRWPLEPGPALREV